MVLGKRVSDEGGCGYIFGNFTKCAEQARLELKNFKKDKVSGRTEQHRGES